MRLTNILFYKVHNIPYRYRRLVFLQLFIIVLCIVISHVVRNNASGVYTYNYIYRKYRIEKKPTLKDIIQFKNDLEREEQNMLLLRHPYLTVQQSHGHMSEFKAIRHAKVQQQWQEEKNVKFNREVTIADRLKHLMVNEVWD